MQPTGPAIPLKGLPQGLTAHAVVRTRHAADGTKRLVNARQTGMPHYSQVDLTATTLQEHLAPDAIPALARAGDRAFVLNAAHREWRAVQQRYGGSAWATAITLTRAGVVALRCNVTASEMALGSPIRWYRTDAATRAAAQYAKQQTTTRDQLRTGIQDALDTLHPHLSRASTPIPTMNGLTEMALESLRSALQGELDRPVPAPKRSRILIAVARDLCEGTIHPNARAFSQAHTGHTKTWDDARPILQHCGVTPAVATAIGLQRDSRIGAGGAIALHAAGHSLPLNQLRGPLLLRAEQTDLRLALTGAHLVVVENLQAAETLCDALNERATTSDVGIAYCGGMPSAAVLHRIADLAAAADKIVIAPDADLGGIRIATATYQTLSPADQTRSVICDVGAAAHAPQRPWARDSPVWEALKTAQAGPAGALAQSCLARGYPVEQETAIVESVLRLI
ncbi:DUF2399 domain-containing protein [Streptomyces europaeiscabiei]|uniref:DUF2399 domain-containing protein n=1 Tax=Streptomyces europaeiscabiei TaxID=146819 RepID=UPI0029AB7BF8|nr:DUF2399 domain-containing protein [Streptomyces europaeiscabiei]MDX3716291.1 DUF2399 domain-containing protein [Streptomyces europaeiscabiei]